MYRGFGVSHLCIKGAPVRTIIYNYMGGLTGVPEKPCRAEGFSGTEKVWPILAEHPSFQKKTLWIATQLESFFSGTPCT